MPPEFTPETLDAWMKASPFISFMALELVSADAAAGRLTMKMPMRPEFERGAGSGQFHGGPIAALIDTVGDFAVAFVVKGGVPTINFRVDYLRPSSGAYLLASASVRRVGRTIGVVDIDVFDDQQRLTAVGRGCYGAQPG
ncbi:MAG: PaaI family thioesterase [Burkholderiaceae bacterium]|nr:MAG: PaaI family thioesterase [Burkholderiaceae bacterium]MCC7284966.1 PaaI family thioesterase [Burkholderiaceae bacterium]